MFAGLLLAAAMVLSLPPADKLTNAGDRLCPDGSVVTRKDYNVKSPDDLDISVFTDDKDHPLFILHWSPGPDGKADAAAVFIGGKWIQMTIEELRAAYSGACDPKFRHETSI